jgi:hypothetical protein
MVIERGIEGVPLLAAYDPTLIAPGSEEHRFALDLRQTIQSQITAAKAQGLKVYAWIQPRFGGWTSPSGQSWGALARRDDAAGSRQRGGATPPGRARAAQSGA